MALVRPHRCALSPTVRPRLRRSANGPGRRATGRPQANPEPRSTVQALTRILDQRVAAMRRRVDGDVERGELPPVDSSFLGEMISGPVHLIVNRGMRSFTRTDAERIVGVVLAGIRATAPHA
jgi:tetracycline repressor-like protein